MIKHEFFGGYEELRIGFQMKNVENINKKEIILCSIYIVHCYKILYVCNIYQ
jgi:hypothetical protein